MIPMPLIQTPQSSPISSSSGLITDASSTNIPSVAKISSEALPYVRVGGTLYGERGMNISGSSTNIPLVSMKTSKEVEDVNAMKVKEFKGGLMAQGYSEIAPNVLSKRANGKYDIINIDTKTGDVVNNIMGSTQYGLFNLQNRLSNINWSGASMSTRNKLIGNANKLGYTVDKGKLIPKGYYVTGAGKVKLKTSGWFGTPEGLDIMQSSQHPELFGYAVGRAIERNSPAGVINSIFQVSGGKIVSTPRYKDYQDYLNINLATDRANQRAADRAETAYFGDVRNKLFSQDKMSLIKGDTNTAIKDFIWGKRNW